MTKSNKMTKSVKNSKNAVVSAVSDWVLNTLSSSLSKEQVESVRETIESKKNDLHSILYLNTSSKKVKDPNAPKRGKTSYIFFCLEHRDHIKKKNPDMSAKDIIKELGTLWRNTPNDKKQKYVKMAESDKERYSGELTDYVPAHTDHSEQKLPKRSLTSYIFFCKEQRNLLKDQQTTLSTKDITTELGKKWKALSDEQKSPYVKLAEDDKNRYNSEKSPLPKPSKEVKPTKEVKPSKDVKPSKQNKNTKSGFDLFCKEEKESLAEEHPKWSSQQLNKELEKYWNDLSTDEQVEYNDRASS